jgi:hypothetical protein
MTVVTVRPDTDVSQVGSSNVGGAASRHAAMADDLDTTYVEYDATGDGTVMEFADPTIPGTAAIVSVALRVRTRKSGSGNPKVMFNIEVANAEWEPYAHSQQMVVSWTSFLTSVAVSFNSEDQDLTVSSVTFNVAALNGKTLRIAEAFLDVMYATKPTLDVQNPTGTLTETNIPAPGYLASTDSDGGPIQKAQYKIFNSAQYGAGGFAPGSSSPYWDSGEFSFGDPPDIPALPDDSYRFYVRIAQTVAGADHWSDWTYEAFVVDVDKPATPTLLANGQDSDGRVRLRVHAETGVKTTDFFEVQRNDPVYGWVYVYSPYEDNLWPADLLWTPSTPSQPAKQGYDYEARNGVQETYRARAVHDYGGGNYAYSPWTSDVTATWTSTDWWLKSAEHPTGNMVVILRSQPSRTRVKPRGIFKPLGRKFPVAVSDARQADEGEVVFRFGSEDESLALDDFLDNNDNAVLLQGPPEATRWHDRWMSLGDLTEDRALDTAWGPYTFAGFAWSEIERPASAVTDEAWMMIGFV